MKIEIKSRYAGKLLWSGEAANLKDGVHQAVWAGVSLAGADLAVANLVGARLGGADLAGAILAGADLAGANLSDACLVGAILVGANLARANLTGADLADANLAGASLVGANLTDVNFTGANLAYASLDEPICRIDFGRWAIYIRANETIIGCQRRANSDWLKWTSKSRAIRAMHPDAPAWWAVHGDAIKAVIRCVMRKAEVTK